MNNLEFIGVCFNCRHIDMKKIDDLEHDFGVLSFECENDFKEALKQMIKCDVFDIFGLLCDEFYKNLINKAVSELNANENDFDIYINGAATSLYCKGETVYDWNDIERLYC